MIASLRRLFKSKFRPVLLRDGTLVMVRPIRPEDRAKLREGLARLSPQSRYNRFLSPVHQLSETQLRYLTEVDHVDHEAFVARDLTQRGFPGIGVARYIRRADDPAVAEAAITVVDSHQGRGLGRVLFDSLAEAARAHGVERFQARFLAENAAMDHLLTGGRIARRDADGVVEIELAVPETGSWRRPSLLHWALALLLSPFRSPGRLA